MIYPILPYDVWDFTILPLLPYAILEIIFRLSDCTIFDFEVVYNHAFFLAGDKFFDSPILSILPILRFNHNRTLLVSSNDMYLY